MDPQASVAAPPPPPPPQATQPSTLRDYVRETAKKYQVDPELAFTILDRESRGVHQAADGSITTGAPTPGGHAVGFFQLMPATAKAYNLDPADPFQNIEAGIRNIREASDHDPNPAAIFGYYHGGPDLAQHGPVTAQYVKEALADFRQRVEARERGAAAPGATSRPDPPGRRPERPGDIHVPTAEELKQRTTPTTPATPSAPPWYSPSALLATGEDLALGAAKGAGQTAANLGGLVHKIPGVSSAVDALYGRPGLSAEAFRQADQVLAPSDTTQKVGKFGEQVAEALVPASKVAGLARGVTAATAPRLAPIVGKTAARLLPRAAIEGAGAAGIAKAQGQDPGWAAGIAGSIPVLGEAGRALFASKLPAVGQAAVDFGRAHGIPIDLATSTANLFMKRLQVGAENSLLGAPVRQAVEYLRGKRLTALGEDLADKIHPVPLTPSQAGKSVGQALDTRVGTLGREASVGYDAAEQAVAGLPAQQVTTGQISTHTGAPIMTTMQAPVAMGPIRQALRPLLKELEGATIAVQEASPALPALRRIMGGGDYHELLALEKDLGALKGLADASGGLRNRSQGIAAQGVRVLQDAVDHAATQADPAILAGLQKGRRETALKHMVDDLRTKFSGTAHEVQTRGAEPMRGFDLATRADDVNIEYLTKLAKEVGQPEMRKLGRGYLQNLLTTATEEGGYKKAAAVANKWNALGDQTKQLLYSPQHIADLDNFFRLGRMLAEHPNPSGSGTFAHAVGQVFLAAKNPVWGVGETLGTGAMAILMNHPTGVRLLTQGLTIPGGTPAAAQWLQQAHALLKDDKHAPPPPPPMPPARATTPRR